MLRYRKLYTFGPFGKTWLPPYTSLPMLNNKLFVAIVGKPCIFSFCVMSNDLEPSKRDFFKANMEIMLNWSWKSY